MNKKRTIVTIIGIVLATALITTVANFAVSFRASMIEYEKKASGNFHYIFHDVSADNLKYFENNRAIETLGHTAELGYALLPDGKNEDKPYLYFMMADDDAFSQMSMQLIEGRLPENDHEIVISKHIWTNGGVQYQVGDTITVDMGNRYRISEESDSEEAATILNQQWDYCYDSEEFISDRQVTYTVVGIMERPIYQIELSTAPGYTVIVGWNDETAPEQQTLYATYTKEGLHNREAVTAGLLDIPLE
jgi:putative ABC transport system permease protein